MISNEVRRRPNFSQYDIKINSDKMSMLVNDWSIGGVQYEKVARFKNSKKNLNDRNDC